MFEETLYQKARDGEPGAAQGILWGPSGCPLAAEPLPVCLPFHFVHIPPPVFCHLPECETEAAADNLCGPSNAAPNTCLCARFGCAAQAPSLWST